MAPGGGLLANPAIVTPRADPDQPAPADETSCDPQLNKNINNH